MMIFELKIFLMLIRQSSDTNRVMNTPIVTIKSFITKSKLMPHLCQKFLNARETLSTWLSNACSSVVPNKVMTVPWKTGKFPCIHEGDTNQLPMELLNEINTDHFKNKPLYSASIIRYSEILISRSLQSFKLLLQIINPPSVSYIRKLKQSNIDQKKSSKILRNEGKKSFDLILRLTKCFYKNLKSLLEASW